MFSTAPKGSWRIFGNQNQAKPKTKDGGYLDWFSKTIPATWQTPEHVRLIAEHIDAVEAGQIDRLLITMPPRHGKSETTTKRYPLYCLEKRPDENVLVTGYNERFARKFGRATRNMAAERGLVAPDKAAADEWATTAGGLYMARGVGSPPTGTGFSRIIIDDPIRRREDAESDAYREKVWDWYSDDLYTRLEPGGALIIVMTLWHHDDIGARAVASEPGKWTILKLPAISDDGKALWPERFSIAALERIRSVTTGFEALYQCNPTPREGSLFQVSKIGLVDQAPEGLPKARGWDFAATQDAGDYTASVLIEGPDADGVFYETPMRFQCEPSERNRRIRQRAELDGAAVRIRLPQDPGAAGKEVAGQMLKLLAGYPVKAMPVTGDKTLRSEPHASQVNAGNVRVVTGGTDDGRKAARDYIEELRQFPMGKHDDQVDAAADALSELMQRPKGTSKVISNGSLY